LPVHVSSETPAPAVNKVSWLYAPGQTLLAPIDHEEHPS
jgi:hypothetical protein